MMPRLKTLTFVLLLSLALAWPLAGNAQNINTYAGGGLTNNVPAPSAVIGQPTAVARDAGGNFFICSSSLGAVFKMDPTGQLTLVAGNDTFSFSGDGGSATSAGLAGPSGVTVDASGNLFIADAGNNRIRRVDAATQIITTVAGNGTAGFSGDGGPATLASLSSPSGVAVDASGNLFVADTNNHRIRKVAAGTITTVVGNGTAGFSGDGGPATLASLSSPSGVAVDASGNLFIADTNNHRIRRVDAATQIITTVAGNGTAGFSGDNGPATSAQLNFPFAVAVDASGNLFIADKNNNRIRKVAAGTITTVAGNGNNAFSGDGGPATRALLNFPEGIAVDGSGNLFIADDSNNRIRRVDAVTKIITTVAGNGTFGFSGDGGLATSAQLNSPFAVAVDASGNLFVADTNNHRIRRVDAATKIITTVAGNGTPGFSGDGGLAASAQLNFPLGIAVDASGNLFIADNSNQRIRKVAAGTITTVAGNGTAGFSGDGGPATSASLSLPNDVAVDSSGNLFIADSANNRIRRVDAATGIITTVAGNGTAGFSGDNGPATSAQLNIPIAVAVSGAGNLFIGDDNNSRVRRVDTSTGKITSVAGNGNFAFTGDGGPATSAALNFPEGLALTGSGNLFISDVENNRVRIVTLSPAAAVSPVALTFASQNVGATTAPQTVTFTNSGDAPLTINAVTLTGANSGDFAQTNNCGALPATLTSGGKCTFSVTYTPTGGGARNATLSITDTAPRSPHTVALTGTGRDFSLAVVGSASATITAGQTASYTLQVVPSGFNGTVTLACSGAPTLAACAVNPASVTPNGTNPVPFTVTLTTTARGFLVPRPDRPSFGPPLGFRLKLPLLLPLAALLLLLSLLAVRRRNAILAVPPAVVFFALLLVGCNNAMQGTPRGTSTITVTGTSGSVSRTASLTLTVN